MIDQITTPQKVNKGWGYELIIVNRDDYCGKILHFNKDAKFSLHFHMKKTETWYVQSGSFILTLIDTTNADKKNYALAPGHVITIEPGLPHQITCIEEGDVYEFSTHHEDCDSYRVEKGNSQFISSSSQ
jgi:mannose-6-phosphate isomerase-like protein (cupin superfamily)